MLVQAAVIGARERAGGRTAPRASTKRRTPPFRSEKQGSSFSPAVKAGEVWGLSLALVAGVTVEGTRGSELTKLMAHHVLRHEHRDELASVVHRKGETNGVGEHR